MHFLHSFSVYALILEQNYSKLLYLHAHARLRSNREKKLANIKKFF